jgi:hypothetical protein
MSFGAVVALIAVYEKWGAQMAHLFHRGGFVPIIARDNKAYSLVH